MYIRLFVLLCFHLGFVGLSYGLSEISFGFGVPAFLHLTNDDGLWLSDLLFETNWAWKWWFVVVWLCFYFSDLAALLVFGALA